MNLTVNVSISCSLSKCTYPHLLQSHFCRRKPSSVFHVFLLFLLKNSHEDPSDVFKSCFKRGGFDQLHCLAPQASTSCMTRWKQRDEAVTIKGTFMDCLETEGESRGTVHKCLKMVSQVGEQYSTSKFVTADRAGPGQCLWLYFPGEL